MQHRVSKGDWLYGPLLAFLLAAAPAVAQNSWVRLAGPDASYSIELPGQAAYSSRPASSAKGTAFTRHIHELVIGDKGYHVETAVYPADVDLADPKQSLQRAVDGVATRNEGKRWASVTWGQHQGHVSVDAIGMREGRDYRLYMVLKARQVFAVACFAPQGACSSPEANRIIASLKVQ